MHIVLEIQNFVQKSLEKSMVRSSHFLYAEMRSGFIYAIEGRLFDLVINNELFLEISNLFLSGEEHPQKIKHIVFDHMRDYSEDVFEYRIREQLDPELDFATKDCDGI